MGAKCWECGSDAQASCRFCGRFVCKDHASKMPVFLAVYVGANQTPKAIVVADAIWCGICRPHPEPIEMPDIY
jgi:hypothetical protein